MVIQHLLQHFQDNFFFFEDSCKFVVSWRFKRPGLYFYHLNYRFCVKKCYQIISDWMKYLGWLFYCRFERKNVHAIHLLDEIQKFLTLFQARLFCISFLAWRCAAFVINCLMLLPHQFLNPKTLIMKNRRSWVCLLKQQLWHFHLHRESRKTCFCLILQLFVYLKWWNYQSNP